MALTKIFVHVTLSLANRAGMAGIQSTLHTGHNPISFGATRSTICVIGRPGTAGSLSLPKTDFFNRFLWVDLGQ
jgi:hypothetical protein